MKYRFFGNNIEPACEYCTFSVCGISGSLLCRGKKAVAPSFSCRHFVYDPTKRVPRPMAALPKFSPDEFSL